MFCRHVYEDIGSDTCPDCGNIIYSRTDWEQIHRLHREWIASGKAVTQGWWSI